MNFGEAIKVMKGGKRVCRKGWKTVWLAINNLEYGCPSFIYYCKDNSINEYPVWYPSQEDMLAEDWEIKAEPPKVKNDMNMLLYTSFLMFFYALENLHNERDTYSPFCGKNRD